MNLAQLDGIEARSIAQAHQWLLHTLQRLPYLLRGAKKGKHTGRQY
jgi:hypothetical protein